MTKVIEVTDLRKTFKVGFWKKRVEVLKGVTFDVSEKEIFGFLGPNGCGKTTTIKIILGIIFANSGEAKIFGLKNDDVKLKQDIGYMPDSPYFYQYLSGEEFLHFYGQLFSMRYQERTKRIRYLLDLVDLTHAKKTQLRKYSKGMLQRIGIAQALINDPKLIIMDEPMEGVDPIGRKQIRDIILQLKDNGRTVFFSTHILADAEMICDRVTIMVQGKIEGQGRLTDLLQANIKSVDLVVKNPDPSLLEQIERKGGSITRQGDQCLLNISAEEKDPLLKMFIDKNIEIVSMIPHKESLEKIFMAEIK